MVNHTSCNGQDKQLPRTVSSRNHHIGGVDPLDQIVDHLAAESPFHKFWKECFLPNIDKMVFYSYILYKQNSLAQQKITQFKFICTLIEE